MNEAERAGSDDDDCQNSGDEATDDDRVGHPPLAGATVADDGLTRSLAGAEAAGRGRAGPVLEVHELLL
ncbi:hypothetical protein BH09PAT3_BH09PAT3_6580 [soil metagenome]